MVFLGLILTELLNNCFLVLVQCALKEVLSLVKYYDQIDGWKLPSGELEWAAREVNQEHYGSFELPEFLQVFNLTIHLEYDGGGEWTGDT